MGKNVFGAKRLRMISDALKEKEEYFCEAWGYTEETDYRQEELDSCLRQIFGENLVPFNERYQFCKEWDYSKRSKKK